jgi:regulatory protein
MALAYGALATSAGKLEAYLARKLRERGWDGEEGGGESAVASISSVSCAPVMWTMRAMRG